MMRIAVDDGLAQGGAGPFLLCWTLRVPDAGLDGAALRRMLVAACQDAAEAAGSGAEAAVEAYRAALVALGRNPNRYRVSSDALLRRCRRDGEVPSILPLVDLNNVLSLLTGWPIGCYARAAVAGDVVCRLGRAGETMATLGKGEFDIARLPVLCDAVGPFGSPVSDSVRTAVGEPTMEALFVLYGFGPVDAAALAAVAEARCAAAGGSLVEPPRLVRP